MADKNRALELELERPRLFLAAGFCCKRPQRARLSADDERLPVEAEQWAERASYAQQQQQQTTLEESLGSLLPLLF